LTTEAQNAPPTDEAPPMPVIFLSHSNKDDFEAVAIRDWLKENGWDDVFLDLDPEKGDDPGKRWERALHEEAAHCEAVIFLVSRNWLNMERRRSKYELARKLNKRIFIALIENLSINDLPLHLKDGHQTVSLAPSEDNRLFRVVRPGAQAEREVVFSVEGLGQLKTWLSQAGVDPRFFRWPPESEPDRAPFRGFEPLEAADAGIFFGRNAPMIEALDVLRGMAEAAPPRVFVVLGASGVGKSSFLRAGLWPRLARDGRHFLPLPVIRPGRAPMNGASGLVSALSSTAERIGLGMSRAQICDAVAGGAIALRPLLRELAGHAATTTTDARRLSTLIFPIDQAEELFSAESALEGRSLLTLLKDLASTDDPPIIALFAIRSEFYDKLQAGSPLEGPWQRIFALSPLPREARQMVIEGPLERLALAGRKLEIDPGLKQALLDEANKAGGDALPLLAFALEQFYRIRGATSCITHPDFQKLGGLAGMIDAALGRVFAEADADPRIPESYEARLALLRRGLIPCLAGVDPQTKTARRRIARVNQLPEDARPLIDLLVEHRLLTRHVDLAAGETALEPGHEAFLRQWGRLKRWLEEDFGRLATLESVKRASLEWDVSGRSPAWAAHDGTRLEEAERLYARPDFTALLDATDRAYLADCMKKGRADRDAEDAQSGEQIASEREPSEKLSEPAQSARKLTWISSLAAVLAVTALAGAQWLADTKDGTQKKSALTTDAAKNLLLDLPQKLKDVSRAPTKFVSDLFQSTQKPQEPTLAETASSDRRRSESVALNQAVDARLAAGDTKAALVAAQQSVALMEALMISNPKDAGWRRDLSVSYEKLGDVQSALGDLVGALTSYRSDLAIAEALSTSDPNNAQFRWDLSVSYEKVGDVQKAQGDLPGALKSYRDDLAIRETLSISEPDNVAWRRDLGVGYERIGATLAQQRETEGAIAAFGRALAIYQDIVRAHPDDAQSRMFSIAPHWRLAQVDNARAREHLEAALSILEPLAAADRLDEKRRGWTAEIRAQLRALNQSAPLPGPPSPEPAMRIE
jgi:tetratricopeptide (TPR) repeat protein